MYINQMLNDYVVANGIKQIYIHYPQLKHSPSRLRRQPPQRGTVINLREPPKSVNIQHIN